MTVRYTIALEDHKAFQAAVRSAVGGFLQVRCLQSFGGPISLLFLVWLFTHYEYGIWPTIAGIAPAIALSIYLWRESPGLWRRANLESMHREGKLSGHLGEHSLEISKDGLLECNAAGQHLSRWREIQTIYSTAEHTLFITRTSTGYILPKKSVIEGNYEQFIESARALWQATGA